MARTKIITAAVLQQVPILIDQGLTAPDIARNVGCTLGTLQVVCSKSKISLRQKNPAPAARRVSSDGRTSLTIRLNKKMIELLGQEASEKGLSASTLAAKLLKVIVKDGLYNAVLDDRPRLPPKRAFLSGHFLEA